MAFTLPIAEVSFVALDLECTGPAPGFEQEWAAEEAFRRAEPEWFGDSCEPNGSPPPRQQGKSDGSPTSVALGVKVTPPRGRRRY